MANGKRLNMAMSKPVACRRMLDRSMRVPARELILHDAVSWRVTARAPCARRSGRFAPDDQGALHQTIVAPCARRPGCMRFRQLTAADAAPKPVLQTRG